MEEIDTSWIDTEDVIEKESMNKVTCYYIYVNTTNEVNHIESEICSLEGTDSTKISRSRLLGLIQRKKSRNGAKYRLFDIMQYNVPYDFTGLIENSYNNLMKSVITADEIEFEKSLCIFHEINCVFIIFQEIPRYWDEVTSGGLKPALKINTEGDHVPKKKTKRVSFKELDLRHTRKWR